jgi:hypothetical protein
MLGADVVDSNQEGLRSEGKTENDYLSSSVALGILVLVLVPKLRMEVHSALGDGDEVRLPKRGRGATRMIRRTIGRRCALRAIVGRGRRPWRG